MNNSTPTPIRTHAQTGSPAILVGPGAGVGAATKSDWEPGTTVFVSFATAAVILAKLFSIVCKTSEEGGSPGRLESATPTETGI